MKSFNLMWRNLAEISIFPPIRSASIIHLVNDEVTSISDLILKASLKRFHL